MTNIDHEFPLRYALLQSLRVNSRAELVALAPGLRSEWRCWLGVINLYIQYKRVYAGVNLIHFLQNTIEHEKIMFN